MLPGLIGAEPRHLAALAAVAEERSFKAAADRRGYVESAVRHQIAQLERVVGTALIDRSRGLASLKLTAAGAALLPHAVRITTQFDAMAADLRAQADGPPALRVGVPDCGVSGLLLVALRALAETDPDLRVEVCDQGNDADQRDGVLRGAIDVGLGDLPQAPSPFVVREVATDPVVLVARAGAARSGRPTLLELATLPLIADRTWPTAARLESRIGALDVPGPSILHAEMTSSVQALAVAGIGMAILPRMAVDTRDSRLALTDLGHLVPARRVGLYWHRDRKRLRGIDALASALVVAAASVRPERLFVRSKSALAVAA